MVGKVENGASIILVFLFLVVPLHAQERKPEGMPPAMVVVSELRSGVMAPETEFIGTVYFLEVSDVAAESNGRVERVYIEEGKRIKEGEVLVKLNSDLLEKTLQGAIASHEEVLTNLEKAKLDLSRIESLYQKKVVPEQLYDENRFRVQSLEKKATSLFTEVERLEIELQRKSVKGPFNGIVMKKHVDTGEWLQIGSVVATIARDETVDVLVEVPEAVLNLINAGMEVKVKVRGKEMKGKIFAVIPRGDVSTRTFPVRIRMANLLSLVEGMEARVSLPTMEKKRSLTAPRDAVLSLFGQTVLFAIVDSRSKMIPVNVLGYQGDRVGIEGEGLSEGMKVVVKGNERLRDGQMVIIASPSK